jgi:hypothetical protein
MDLAGRRPDWWDGDRRATMGLMTHEPDVHSAGHVALVHRTLVAYSRALTHFGTRGGLEEHDGIVLCAGGTWIPMIANTAFRLEPDVSPTELLTRADAFFGGLARGYTVPVRDNGEDEDLRAACLAAGLELFGSDTPDMVCAAPLPERAAPAGISLREVKDSDGVREFVEVNSAAYATYGMPPEVHPDLFDNPDAVLADPGAHIVVASKGDTPVATALVYESDGAATVQWVGTLPGARTSGLGALVTVWVTNLAFRRGASSVSLQASPMGAPIYLKLGYETVHQHVEYVRMPARAAETG